MQTLHDRTRRIQTIVALSCVIFLVFFRARFAFQIPYFDEGCYYEWLHKLIGIPYKVCYIPTHLPGAAVVWLPSAALSAILGWVTPAGFEDWLVPLSGLSSFLAWALSFYLLDKMAAQLLPKAIGLATPVWTLLFLLNIPLLEFVTERAHMGHAAEVLAATLAFYFLLQDRYAWALVASFWLVATRMNDLLVVGVIAGRFLDTHPLDFQRKIPRKYLAVAGGVLAALAFAVYWVGFKNDHGGFRLADILGGAKLATVGMLLFTPSESLLIFMSLWCLAFAFGAFYFRHLTWMSRAGWVWMLSVFVFYAAHRSVWVMDGPHFRFFIGTYLCVFTIGADLLRAGKISARGVKVALVAGAVWYTAYRWTGLHTTVWLDLITGRANPTALAYDGSGMSIYLRKLFLEPVGLSAPSFAIFSWGQSMPVFAAYERFRVYTVTGPSLWTLTFTTIAAVAYLAWLLGSKFRRRSSV